MVQVTISSALCSTIREISPQWSWKQLCDKLFEYTGVSPSDMQLTVLFQDQNSVFIESPTKEQGSMSDLLQKKVSELQVADRNSESLANQLANEFAETTKDSEPTFHLSEESYQNRADSVLKWKKDCGLGKFDPSYQAKLEQDRAKQQKHAVNLTLNERCSVITPSAPERRGWLRFLGTLPSDAVGENLDLWCGVEFDEPVGKNDGSFKGKVIFGPVQPQYGAFVKPTAVTTSPKFKPLFNADDFSDDEL